MELNDFINNCSYGYDIKKGELSELTLDPFQYKFFNHINENKFSLVKKPRQTYVSTMLATYVVWQLLYGTGTGYQGSRVLLYTTTKMVLAKSFLRKVKDILRHSCDTIGYRYQDIVDDEWTDRINMVNGNKFMVRAYTERAIKGIMVDDLIIDEAAHIPNLQSLFSALVPMISSGEDSRMIIASTPNGMNMFFDLHSAAIKGENAFAIFNIKWSDVTSRDENWLKDMKRLMNNDNMFRQEIYAEFINAVTYMKLKRKDRLVQARIPNNVFDKLNKRLLELDMSQSDYLRLLLEMDLG